MRAHARAQIHTNERAHFSVHALTDARCVCGMSGHITVTPRLRPSLKREDKSKLETEPAISFSVSLLLIGSLVCSNVPQHLSQVLRTCNAFYIANIEERQVYFLAILSLTFHCTNIWITNYKLFAFVHQVSLKHSCCIT